MVLVSQCYESVYTASLYTSKFMVEYFKGCMYILQQYKLNKNIWSGDTGENWDAQAYKDLPLRPLAFGPSHCIL